MEKTSLADEIGTLIIETLRLEDVQLSGIAPDAPLFGEGLGLDSIDALELALALSQRYGVKISSDDPAVQSIFGSLSQLAQYVEEHRAP